jgi:hypothetical protein
MVEVYNDLEFLDRILIEFNETDSRLGIPGVRHQPRTLRSGQQLLFAPERSALSMAFS